MSYYRELKDFILQIKGDFFLSPRDRWFLKFLEEEGYPLEVVKEGIRKFFLFHPPNRTSKLPLFMSFEQIRKLKRFYIKKTSQGLDWKERFFKKLRLAEEILGKACGGDFRKKDTSRNARGYANRRGNPTKPFF